MWKILGVALSLLFAILTSCENSTQTDPLDNSNLIPLEIGNKWEYEFTQYRFNPDDSLKTLFDSTTNVMEVVRIDTIDNFIGYIVDQIPIKFTFNAQLPIYYYKSRGLYTAEYPYWLTVPPSPAHEYLLLLHPSYVGQENMLGNIIIRTAAINETVELFDKEYRCIRYEVINDRGEVYAEIWITPGVGIVKVWQQINLMTYYSNLKTYKIK